MAEQVKSGADPETTSVHVITCAGRLSAGQLKTIAEAAERFGTGEVRTDAPRSAARFSRRRGFRRARQAGISGP